MGSTGAKAWNGITTAAKATWNGIKTVAKATWNSITTVAKPIFKPIACACDKIASGFNWVDQNIFGGAIGWVGRNTIGRIYQFGNWVYDKIV